MQITLTPVVLLYTVLIVMGMFAGVVLFTRRKDDARARLYLGGLLVCVSLWLVDALLRVSGVYRQNPNLYFLPIYYSFAFGPLVYFYVRSLVDRQFRWRWGHVIHFVPVVVQGALYIFLSLQSYDYKLFYWMEVHQPYTYRIEFDGTFLSLAIYLVFSLWVLSRYRRAIREQFSELSRIRLTWLVILMVLILLLCILWFIEAIARDFYDSFYQVNYTTAILGLLTLVLAYGGLSQDALTTVELPPTDPPTNNKVIPTDLIDKVRHHMESESAYLQAGLSLKTFAENCHLPVRSVSEVINHGIGKTFHDYVNELRVIEVQNRLKTVDLSMYTITGVALECGFNSKATFNRLFKEHTGITPTSFLNQQRK